jgi:hypothetical protein
MALTDEQRAMLQLLLEGGQGYDDIASLLGISGDEVRSRAREALREIGGADPDAQVGLSDYLLGQADPIGRADAVRHLQSDPEANALAQNLAAQLRLLAPKAQLPEIPPPRGGKRAAPPPPPPAAPDAQPRPAGHAPPPAAPPSPAATGESLAARLSRPFQGLGSLSRRQSQVVVGLGAGALLILVAVLAIAGVFGGGDDASSTQTQASTGPSGEDLSIVPLAPVSGDTGATGQAVFARAGDQPVLQINLSGLQPAGKDQSYIVWLFNSDRIAFPLARDVANQNGDLTGAAPVPNEVVPLLPQFGCIDVSIASNSDTQAALQAAVQGKTLPQHSGQTVLRGEIPREGSEPASGAESQCEQAPATGTGGAGAGGLGGAGAGEATPPAQ